MGAAEYCRLADHFLHRTCGDTHEWGILLRSKKIWLDLCTDRRVYRRHLQYTDRFQSCMVCGRTPVVSPVAICQTEDIRIAHADRYVCVSQSSGQIPVHRKKL